MDAAKWDDLVKKTEDLVIRKEYDAVGVFLHVNTAVVEDGGLVLTGRPLNSNKHVNREEIVTVVFREELASKSVENFIKGNGRYALEKPDSAAGNVVALEGCYPINGANGERVLTARWLKTVHNVKNENHKNRTYGDGYIASAPYISFNNPDIKPGEPKHIAIHVNEPSSVTCKIQNKYGSFHKEFPISWAIDKLSSIPASAPSRPNVYINVYEPDEAVSITSIGDFERVIIDQLQRGPEAMVLLRLAHEDRLDDVQTREIFLTKDKDWNPDYEETVRSLVGAKNVFRNLDGLSVNGIFELMGSGGLILEAIPGYKLGFMRDTSQKIISDVVNSETKSWRMKYGEDPSRYSRVLLAGDVVDGVEKISHLKLIHDFVDVPGTFLLSEFNSKNIIPNIAPRPVSKSTRPSEPVPDFAAMESAFDAAVGAGAEDDAPSGPRP